MVQIKEQTHEEKVKMYMKLTKRELIEMVIEVNRILSAEKPFVYVSPDLSNKYTYSPSQPIYIGTPPTNLEPQTGDPVPPKPYTIS